MSYDITDRSETSGLLDQPSIKDLSETIRFVIPSEDRDFSRPRDSYYAQSFPDTAMADDSGQDWVKQVQKIMKNNPISPSYPGPIDGIITRKLLDVLLNFSWTLKKKTGKSFKIVSGSSIDQGQLAEALKELKKYLHPETVDESEESEDKSDATILAFQKFFSESHPVIGVLYDGPQDGKINDELISAAQNAENKISMAVKTRGAQGMIWSGKGFATSTSDVEEALQLIKEHV